MTVSSAEGQQIATGNVTFVNTSFTNVIVTPTFAPVPVIEGDEPLGRDDRVSLSPLSPDTALRALMSEIRSDPEEVAELAQSAHEYDTGDGECLEDNESIADAIE